MPIETDKIIWTFWKQGYESAPDLVKRCIASWVSLNPTWKVIVLDEESAEKYVSPEVFQSWIRANLPVQQISVLLRLELLKHHGGVWADCTVYCTVPLDGWLPEHLKAGFFAFRNPGPDRLISNWFLAADKDNPLIERFCQVTAEFFSRNRFPPNTLVRRILTRGLGRLWNADTHKTRYWFSWPVRRLLAIYPYFVNHYLFSKLLENDLDCRKIWASVKPIEAQPLLVLKRFAKFPDGVDRASAELRRKKTPMYKLDWRVNRSQSYWKSILKELDATYIHRGKRAP